MLFYINDFSPDLEQRLLKIERKQAETTAIGLPRFYEVVQEQRKAGKRYSGRCTTVADDNLWSELRSIQFMGGDYIGLGSNLFLVLRSLRDQQTSNYRVFSRTTQDGNVYHYVNNGPIEKTGITALTYLGSDLDQDIDLFIESWLWIEHDDGSGYNLKLTFYGCLSAEPKCYLYDINYLEH